MNDGETKFVCMWCNALYEDKPKSGFCFKCGYDRFGEYNVQLSTEKIQIYMLKLGNLDTLNSMRNGNIWFQSPKYYQEYEGSPAICDVTECAFDYIMDIPIANIDNLSDLKIGVKYNLNCKEVLLMKIDKDKKKAYFYSNTQNYNRLLCFYKLGIVDEVLEPRDSNLKSFGSHFCLINYEKFRDKINEYAMNEKIYFSPSDVKYTTDAYHGDYNPTMKSMDYKYQNEFRFILQGKCLNSLPEKDPLKIKIEGMSEIMTEPQPLEKLFEIQTVDELAELFNLKE